MPPTVSCERRRKWLSQRPLQPIGLLGVSFSWKFPSIPEWAIIDKLFHFIEVVDADLTPLGAN